MILMRRVEVLCGEGDGKEGFVYILMACGCAW
jgi:hypothetical protein